MADDNQVPNTGDGTKTQSAASAGIPASSQKPANESIVSQQPLNKSDLPKLDEHELLLRNEAFPPPPALTQPVAPTPPSNTGPVLPHTISVLPLTEILAPTPTPSSEPKALPTMSVMPSAASWTPPEKEVASPTPQPSLKTPNQSTPSVPPLRLTPVPPTPRPTNAGDGTTPIEKSVKPMTQPISPAHLQSDALSTPIQPANQSDTLPKPLAPITPTTPTPAAPATKSSGPFLDSISNILKGIKLPERFDAKASGDRPVKPHQEVPEPVIISETVTSTKTAPAVAATPPTTIPIPQPPIIQTTPVPATSPAVQTAPNSKPVSIPGTATKIPDVGLPTHIASTFAEKTMTMSTVATTTVPPMSPPHPTNPAQVAPEIPKTPEVDSIVTPLRTFKEDLMHVVQDRKISLVRAVALEEDKKRETRQPTPAEIAMSHHRQRRVFAILFTVGVLLFLSAAALAGIYTVQNQHATPAANPNSTSIIFAEQTFSFPLQDLSSGDIKRTLEQARGSSSASLGSITRIVPTVPTTDGTGARAATTAEFFKALGLHVSDDLVRALSNEFFFGIHTIDKNTPILIIPVTSYERAFSGMLEWEPAMNTDLAPAFTQISAYMPGENGLPARRVFEDVVMRNYDTRALKDESGAVKLYYSFPTPNVLIISENPFSFTEILSRLQVQRRL